MIGCPVASVHLKLDELRQEAKFSDVSIIVDGKTFKCHRIILSAASEYFHSMFYGNFKESFTNECRLESVDSELFEKVLRIIYSGEIEISQVDVFDLLRLSEFLSVSAICDYCIEYILGNMQSIENLVDMFVWARSMNILRLVEPLLKYISNNFNHFSGSAAFLEMSFDDLHTVLSYVYSYSRHSLPFRIDDWIMDAIFRWLHNSYIERKDYSEKLGTMIFSMDLSVPYIKFVRRGYALDFSIPEVRVDIITRSNEHPSVFNSFSNFSDYELSRKITSINVCFEEKVLSINKYKPNGFVSRDERSNWSDRYNLILPSRELRYLYCMKTINKNTTFNAYSSVHMSQTSSRALCPPPVTVLQGGIIDEKNDNIYIPSIPFRNRVYPSNSRSFDDYEIASYRLFRYNCELNEWFSVPNRMKDVDSTRSYKMIVCNGLVFLLFDDGNLQAYDARCCQYLCFPKRNKVEFSFDWCIHDGKIHTVDYNENETKTTEVGVFDHIAGKWRIETFIQGKKSHIYRMVPYDDKLWLFRQDLSHMSRGWSDSSIQVYNPKGRQWLSPYDAESGEAILAQLGVDKLKFDTVFVF